ncbi:recombinase family protein [Nocardioides sp.]|uniref:recombinase family protein n=1 Tax=Nocardioides sp. TaxID=35761 RepID=UPI002BDD9AA9|nr:recombinase family protein [Nocardioides sp.]HSX68462.1 recombinase family protein [Nocardioides sp.]
MTLAEWDAYERISDDPTDERAGVGRQHEDNEEAVRARGGRVAVHHCENNTSAYKKKRVELTDQYGNTYHAYRVMRPVWAQALQRLRTGEAKRLMVWDLDRLARDPRDLEDAIEVVEHYGAEIRSATASDIDLSTENGRMNARLLVMMANKSSADTARRVKRQKQERLEKGLPPGSRYRTFGYSRDWQVVEEEAAVVREAYERIAKGESVNAISRDLRERGVVTVSGKPMSFAATARILDSPIYAGLLSYKGEVIGTVTEDVPRLVTEAAFKVASQRATRPAWNTRSNLLSGIAICDVCKTTMNVSGGAYQCARIIGGCGKVRIKKEWLDESVEHAVRFLQMWKRAQDAPTVPVAVESETDPVEEIDRKIEEAQAAHTAGDLDLADLLPILKGLRAQRAKAVASQAAEAEEASTWAAMDDYDVSNLSVKRTIIRRHVVAIPVTPNPKPGNTKFDPSRFSIVTTYKDDDGKPRVLAGEACDLLGSMYGAREFGKANPDFPEFTDELIEVIWGMVNEGLR